MTDDLSELVDARPTRHPEPIGSPGAAVDLAFRRLHELGVRSVLDCPAGRGPLAQRLVDAGKDVVAADIFPEQFEVPEVRCIRADLNESIPLPDGQFEALACLNGLQRVWARGRALREMSRVLRPGGYLLLTFVNNVNLIHRLTFLISGSIVHNTVGPPHVCDPGAEEPAACYRYPMTIANVVSGVTAVGLEVREISAVRLSRASLMLFPLAVLPWVFRGLLPAVYKRFCFVAESSRPAVLFGDYLLVIAQKPARNGR
jgi:SAM-dependent methyltransferase